MSKFYTKDGTEYTKVFENETVVLGRTKTGEYHIIRHEKVLYNKPETAKNETQISVD